MTVTNLSRRNLLKLAAGTSALGVTSCASDYHSEDEWYRGDIQHILPLVSHRAFNIKVSFFEKREVSPVLKVGERLIEGTQQDTSGRFWAFRIAGLNPSTEYKLQMIDPSGTQISDVWPLKTYPSPEDRPEHLRVVGYTCAGGPNLPVLPGNRDAFKPLGYRQKLFDLILDQQPDLVIANGDHIYWDYRTWANNRDGQLAKMAMEFYLNLYGEFNESLPVKGTANEFSLQKVADEQIASIYGVRFRSTPVYFITDDHDYFDNDDASPDLVTFPPDGFHRELRNVLQQLYFPEYIVEENLPDDFPGFGENDSLKLSTHFGSFQYGDLFSGVLYDCGGMLSLSGDKAGLIPSEVESWVIKKTETENSLHFAHFPSHPMGWTAGKWREWYPDLIDSDETILAPIHRDAHGEKYAWQQGWWLQHQRLLSALSSQKKRKPLVLSGDLHLLGAGKIVRSGDMSMEDNPVHSILTGPVGVGAMGWLSYARGLSAKTPKNLSVEEPITPLERNGFTVLNLSREQCVVEQMCCPEGSVSLNDLRLETSLKFAVT